MRNTQFQYLYLLTDEFVIKLIKTHQPSISWSLLPTDIFNSAFLLPDCVMANLSVHQCCETRLNLRRKSDNLKMNIFWKKSMWLWNIWLFVVCLHSIDSATLPKRSSYHFLIEFAWQQHQDISTNICNISKDWKNSVMLNQNTYFFAGNLLLLMASFLWLMPSLLLPCCITSILIFYWQEVV